MPTILRRLLWIAVVVTGSVNVAMLAFGSQVTGISYDEVAHVEDLFGPQNVANRDHFHFGVYGVSYQLMSHFAAVAVAGEPLGDTTYSVDALLARHWVSVVLVITTAAAVAGMVLLLTGDKLIAAWGATTLLAVPVFLGHGMFNPKDIPVACGYSLVTSGCVLWLKRLVSNRASQTWTAWTVVGLISVGIWLAAGTRYIFLPALAVSAIVSSFVAGSGVFRLSLRAAFSAMWGPLAGLAGGYFLLYLTNPCLLMRTGAPLCSFAEVLSRSWSGSSTIADLQPLFFLGELYTQDSKPALALPVNLAAGMPLALLALILAGIVTVFGVLSQLTRRSQQSTQVASVALGIPVALQALLMPSLTIILNASVYDMQRQHLYVYPALTVLAAVGVYAWIRYQTSSLFKTRLVRGLGVSLMLIAVVIPTYESWRLFPYNYVYVNPLASINGYANNWETDYWGLSLREALSESGGDTPALLRGAPNSINAFIHGRNYMEAKKVVMKGDEKVFAIQINRPSFGWLYPVKGCLMRSKISRHLRGHDIPMSYLLECDEEEIQNSNWFWLGP